MQNAHRTRLWAGFILAIAAGLSDVATAQTSSGLQPAFRRSKEANPPVQSDVLAGIARSLLGPSSVSIGRKPKQGICPNIGLVHLSQFLDTGGVKRSDVIKWSRATVRFRVMHESAAKEEFARMAIARRADPDSFILGGFKAYAGYDDGICSGVLVSGNIVLTAGHCVSIKHWHDEGIEYPSYKIGGVQQYLSDAEFVRLLVVDLGYQQADAPVASADPTTFAAAEKPISFTVRELVAPKAIDPVDLDFAILRIAGETVQLRPYWLGVGRVRYPSQVNTSLTIVQHPDGGYKKVSVGETASAGAGGVKRLDYRVSTAPGSSGSGVLDSSGNLVGVHVEGACGQGGPNSALPLRRIRGPLRSALGLK